MHIFSKFIEYDQMATMITYINSFMLDLYPLYLVERPHYWIHLVCSDLFGHDIMQCIEKKKRSHEEYMSLIYSKV